MKKLTNSQVVIGTITAAIVIGGAIYAYTENKKAKEHEQKCLTIEMELVKLAREKKENDEQLSKLVINDKSDYALSVFMLNRARIAELVANNKSLVDQMSGNSGWISTLINECGQPRAAKLVESYPDLFPTSP